MSLKKFPGFIDAHVHLREPGGTHKETFLTGSNAALGGGVTYMLDMPNNSSPTISLKAFNEKIALSEKTRCDIGFYFGTNGKNIEEFTKVWDHPKIFGLKLYCNHTTGEMLLEDIHLLEKVFRGWDSPKPILVHAEGIELAAAIGMAHVYGRKLHVCHISQAVEVELVRRAKEVGQDISAGVTPHHLYMTGDDRSKIGGKAVMKPPLGTLEDREALWEGLIEGVIDIVETDHAPHTLEEKSGDKPAFGVPGLETMVGLMFKAVHDRKDVTEEMVVQWMYDNPREIFSIPEQEDTYVELDPDKPFYMSGPYHSKCGWSPFEGWEMYGQVVNVVIRGTQVVRDGTLIEEEVSESLFHDVDGEGEILEPFYNPNVSYEENYEKGPFGVFADKKTYQSDGGPEHEFLGFPVYEPFGIPAGPLPNGAFVKAAFEKGFDLPVYKTVRTRGQKCHAWPNVLPVDVDLNKDVEHQVYDMKTLPDYTAPLSITNSFGVPSMDPDVWQPDMADAVKAAGKGQVMIGSFQGTNDRKGIKAFVQDYVLGAKLVKETGAKILVANLSCPNEGTQNLLCFDIKRVAKIAFAIKEEIGDTPLLLKLAYFKEDQLLDEFVRKIGKIVDGLIAINTIPGRIFDKDGNQALPGDGRLVSGICGTIAQRGGLDMTKRLVKYREKHGYDFVVVGTGGVMTVEHYHEYRRLGADAVMSATGAMWDPLLAARIKNLI